MDGKERPLTRHPVRPAVLTLTGVLFVLTVMGAVACGGSGTTTSSSASVASSSTQAGSTAASTSTAAPKTQSKPKATKTTSAAKPSSTARAAKTGGSAVVALAKLPVKGRAPMTGYSRGQFGDGWETVAGCNTRDRILRRDLTAKSYLDDCRVQSGHLNDPYTAAAITFQRGGASEVDIDHVVALGDAWQKGAQQWSASRRVALANDPLNLLAVDAGANRQKGDGDAATWLPANKRFRCKYVARQVAVKQRYHAWVTQAEHDAIARVLATCPGEPLPKGGLTHLPVVPTHKAPSSTTTTTQPKPTPSASGGAGRVFANCDAVRAAGLAPLHRGTADYAANPKLDRDDDGIACE